ncbi:494_t:CDS:2, partial [Cetraspora pellucida]
MEQLFNSNISELIQKYLTFEDVPEEFIPEEFVTQENGKHDENNENSSNSSLIVASEDIPENVCFNNWNEVDDFFNDYGTRNGFAVTKYRMEQNSSGQLKANGTLCELVDRLDARLNKEVRWSQFNDYKQATTTNTITIPGQDLFPEITKVIDEYLTEPISNAIKIEMSQCLFISANRIEPNIDELHNKQENTQLASDGFIEDKYDAHFITLQALIDEVGWDKILKYGKSQTCKAKKGITSHMSTLFPRYYALQKATLLAVEQNDNEIVPYLQAYINRSHNKNHYVHKNPTNEIDETSDNSQTNETSEESEESEAEDQDMNGIDLINVKNPSKVFTRGWPSKRRYISSIKKEQDNNRGSKSRGSK